MHPSVLKRYLIARCWVRNAKLVGGGYFFACGSAFLGWEKRSSRARVQGLAASASSLTVQHHFSDPPGLEPVKMGHRETRLVPGLMISWFNTVRAGTPSSVVQAQACTPSLFDINYLCCADVEFCSFWMGMLGCTVAAVFDSWRSCISRGGNMNRLPAWEP